MMNKDIYRQVKGILGEVDFFDRDISHEEKQANLYNHIELVNKIVKDLIKYSKNLSNPNLKVQSMGVMAFSGLVETKKIIEENS